MKLVALAFSAVSISAQAASPAELGPVLQVKIATYLNCLKATDGQLRTSKVTPERYEMAMEGACLAQYDAATKEMKAHLEAIPHPGVSYDDAQSITANTMSSIQSSDYRLRKQNVSAYVLWFSSAERSKGK